MTTKLQRLEGNKNIWEASPLRSVSGGHTTVIEANFEATDDDVIAFVKARNRGYDGWGVVERSTDDSRHWYFLVRR
jgi:hypothetical protein